MPAWTPPLAATGSQAPSDGPYVGWAIVEQLGHRRFGAYVSEVTQYGTTMLRADQPGTERGTVRVTVFVGGSSIFALTPCTEDAARQACGLDYPVTRYALPSPDLTEDEKGPSDGSDDERTEFEEEGALCADMRETGSPGDWEGGPL